MEITPEPDITQEELLVELWVMSWEDIMSVPLTGRFTGLFEGFEEMGNIIEEVMKNDG